MAEVTAWGNEQAEAINVQARERVEAEGRNDVLDLDRSACPMAGGDAPRMGTVRR